MTKFRLLIVVVTHCLALILHLTLVALSQVSTLFIGPLIFVYPIKKVLYPTLVIHSHMYLQELVFQVVIRFLPQPESESWTLWIKFANEVLAALP